MRLRGLLRQDMPDRQAVLLHIHDLIDHPPDDDKKAASRQAAIARVTDKLTSVHYREDTGRPHIEIADQRTCELCEGKYCNYFCPAGVYLWDPSQKLTLVSSGNCIECGACGIGCPYDNIGCHSPRGGYGVQVRLG